MVAPWVWGWDDSRWPKDMGSADRKRAGRWKPDNNIVAATIVFVNLNGNRRKQVGNTDNRVWNGILRVVGAVVLHTASHQRLALRRALGSAT